jgi:hypothetical protein
MSRDRVKTELADATRSALRSMASGLRYRLANHGVQDVEVTQVSELESQVRLKFAGMPPRYFLVKVSEKV